jgi:hypothetical protein
MKKIVLALILFALKLTLPAFAQEIETNELVIPNAPAWLTQSRTQKVVDQIEKVMEWDIRKIHVIWYDNEGAFERVHGFGPSVLAFARRGDNTIHVGPRVDSNNFDGVFGHELVHIIVFQKYKDAIPGWLDEGLANYAANRVSIDYAWLATQPTPDIHTLTHPFIREVNGVSANGNEIPTSARYKYMASTALMEMLASHCDIHDLLQLSVGKKLETYVSTFCEIPDINLAFRNWLALKGKH